MGSWGYRGRESGYTHVQLVVKHFLLCDDGLLILPAVLLVTRQSRILRHRHRQVVTHYTCTELTRHLIRKLVRVQVQCPQSSQVPKERRY